MAYIQNIKTGLPAEPGAGDDQMTQAFTFPAYSRRRAKADAYDGGMNEGGEGFNPHRTVWER